MRVVFFAAVALAFVGAAQAAQTSEMEKKCAAGRTAGRRLGRPLTAAAAAATAGSSPSSSRTSDWSSTSGAWARLRAGWAPPASGRCRANHSTAAAAPCSPASVPRRSLMALEEENRRLRDQVSNPEYVGHPVRACSAGCRSAAAPSRPHRLTAPPATRAAAQEEPKETSMLEVSEGEDPLVECQTVCKFVRPNQMTVVEQAALQQQQQEAKAEAEKTEEKQREEAEEGEAEEEVAPEEEQEQE